MNKALLVIDMQEIYLGKDRNKKLFKYDVECLIKNINDRIDDYNPNEVIYISHVLKNNFLNKFIPFYAIEGTKPAQLVNGLNVVSNIMFTKNKGNAFTNKELDLYLKNLGINDIEVIGIDGGGCVALTALGAINLEYNVTFNDNCIGTSLIRNASKLRRKLIQTNVSFI